MHEQIDFDRASVQKVSYKDRASTKDVTEKVLNRSKINKMCGEKRRCQMRMQLSFQCFEVQKPCKNASKRWKVKYAHSIKRCHTQTKRGVAIT